MAEKRSILIINKNFQFKLCFMICSLVFFSSFIYLISINDLFNQFIASNLENAAKFEDIKIKLFTLLITVQLAYLGIVFAFSVLISHRIAGPLHKLKLYLESVRQGSKSTKVTFRDKDYFHDVAAEVSQTMEYLSQKSEDEIEYLEEVVAYLENISLVVPDDKKVVLNQIQKRIQEIGNLDA